MNVHKVKEFCSACSLSLNLVRIVRNHSESLYIRRIIQLVFCPFGILNYVIKSIAVFFHKEQNNFRYNISIIAILKNEAPYIKEWIDFYLHIGVDHFFLYDNESTDNVLATIKEYIQNKTITYQVIKGKARQADAYNDAIKKYKNLSKYFIVLDLDEFLFPTEGQEKLLDIINGLFSTKRFIGGIVASWLIYGTSGLESYSNEPVAQRFLYRAKKDFVANMNYKSIINPRRALSFSCPHYPLYLFPFFSINDEGVRVSWWFNKSNYKRLRINHYFTKSKSEYLDKRNRGKADNIDLRPIDDFYFHDRNDIFDDSILRYHQ